MLTIHFFNIDTDLKTAVSQKMEELNERKKTDETCNFQVTQNPGGSEYMIDFLIGEKKENRMSLAEFNIYRYKKIESKNGNKGILIYAYTKRAYNYYIPTFYSNLKNDRIKLLNEMIEQKIPEINLNEL